MGGVCQVWKLTRLGTSKIGHVYTKMAMHADCMRMGENGKELAGNEWWRNYVR